MTIQRGTPSAESWFTPDAPRIVSREVDEGCIASNAVDLGTHGDATRDASGVKQTSNEFSTDRRKLEVGSKQMRLPFLDNDFPVRPPSVRRKLLCRDCSGAAAELCIEKDLFSGVTYQ